MESLSAIEFTILSWGTWPLKLSRVLTARMIELPYLRPVVTLSWRVALFGWTYNFWKSKQLEPLEGETRLLLLQHLYLQLLLLHLHKIYE